jgi:hypothetical protein
MMKQLVIFILSFCVYTICPAQEFVAPLNYNPFTQPAQQQAQPGPRLRTTAITLPFFDDFAQEYPQPSLDRWMEWDTYINNTMGISPVSRGVATFDALDGGGIPYNTTNRNALLTADRLTSQPIDLSAYQPGDSLYLSFFYQPQGNGFAPETQDSLIVYFKRRNETWLKVWSKEGTVSQPFRQVMLPVLDTSLFHGNFQFRFANKASINVNDDVWNVDYVKLAANRNQHDTVINDVSISSAQPSFLNDYTYMPYHQFKANENGERAAQTTAYIYNGYDVLQSVNYEYTSREEASNATLFSGGNGNATLIPFEQQSTSFPVHTNTNVPADRHKWISFENKYYLQSVSASDPKANDTFTHHQIFHNFLAYDDGTAEMSYFLKQFVTLPAKTAVEFHLNEPDTIGGVAIYFGRQVPLGIYKTFSVAIYKSIAVNGGQDELVYQQDFLDPKYLHTNNFYYYKFDQSVPLPAGKFYIGTVQPTQGVSDSLYIGLDVNRQGATHAYYNVDGTWKESAAKGALMIRPLIGPFFPSDVPAPVLGERSFDWSVSPNPCVDWVQLSITTNKTGSYSLYDMQGRCLKSGMATNGDRIAVKDMAPGVYSINLVIDGIKAQPQKIVKQ